MNRKRIRKTVMLVSTVIVSLFLSIDCFADEYKDYVLQSYLDFLSSSTVTIHENGRQTDSDLLHFALAYIDSDDIPEMVVRYDDASHVEGFADLFYWNGQEIQRIQLSFNMEDEQVYLPGTGIYSDNNTWQGSGSTMFCSLYAPSYIADQCISTRPIYASDNTFKGIEYSYYANNQEVDETSFYHILKETYGAEPQHYDFYENTEENRERIQNMMNESTRNAGTNMNTDQSQYSDFCWYRISTDYEPGIAVRILPEYESELLTRLPDGTEFFVEDTDGVWGLTNMPSYSGWINLDYAEQLYMPPMYEANAWYTIETDYEPGIAVRSIPSGDGELFTRIPDGTEFYVEEVCDVWGYTSDAMGYAGWVHLDYTSGN